MQFVLTYQGVAAVRLISRSSTSVCESADNRVLPFSYSYLQLIPGMICAAIG
jgi:hypothetical protein